MISQVLTATQFFWASFTPTYFGCYSNFPETAFTWTKCQKDTNLQSFWWPIKLKEFYDICEFVHVAEEKVVTDEGS